MTDVVVTTLLTAVPDPQRAEPLEANIEVAAGLACSVIERGARLVVLADEITPGDVDGVEIVPCERGGNPYFHRWQAIADHLDGADYRRVWCVDATDVEMLRNPFELMEPRMLYVGSEPSTLDHPWLAPNHPTVVAWVAANLPRRLLNAGIVGGSRLNVAALARMIAQRANADDLTDMGVFNQLVHGTWGDGWFQTGSPVHTVFRANDRANPICWWRHK